EDRARGVEERALGLRGTPPLPGTAGRSAGWLLRHVGILGSAGQSSHLLEDYSRIALHAAAALNSGSASLRKGLVSRMGTLDGRVAIVTGAGRGIGRAGASLLARGGAAGGGGRPRGGGAGTRG